MVESMEEKIDLYLRDTPYDTMLLGCASGKRYDILNGWLGHLGDFRRPYEPSLVH